MSDHEVIASRAREVAREVEKLLHQSLPRSTRLAHANRCIRAAVAGESARDAVLIRAVCEATKMFFFLDARDGSAASRAYRRARELFQASALNQRTNLLMHDYYFALGCEQLGRYRAAIRRLDELKERARHVPRRHRPGALADHELDRDVRRIRRRVGRIDA